MRASWPGRNDRRSRAAPSSSPSSRMLARCTLIPNFPNFWNETTDPANAKRDGARGAPSPIGAAAPRKSTLCAPGSRGNRQAAIDSQPIGYGISTARPLILPWCRSLSAWFASLKRYSRVAKITRPRTGQSHNFDQFGIGPHQIADDRLFAANHVHGRKFDLPAITDDVIKPAIARHGQTLGDCIAFADEIDDRLRAAASSQPKHALDFISIALDGVVRAAFLCKLQRGLGAIDDDDFRRAQCVQDLD